MANQFDPGWGFLLFFFIAVYSWPSEKHVEQVEVYVAYCNEKVAGICTDEHTSFVETYKASFETQTVIKWLEHGAPHALQHCVVANAENWQCHEKDNEDADTFSMNDAQFSHTGKYFIPFLYPIGKWKWRWLKAWSLVTPYLQKQHTTG